MKQITTKEAAQELNMTVLTVQVLMQQDKLPIGYAVKRDGCKKYHYIIFKELVDSFKQHVSEGKLLGMGENAK